MRKIISNINSLVSNGNFKWGTYNHPLTKINALDAKISKLSLPKPYKFMRLKEWHAFQLGNKRFFIFIALMNLKKAAFIIMDIFDKTTQKQYRYEKNIPPWKLKLSPNLMDSHIICKTNDFKIELSNKLIYNKINLKLHIVDKKIGKIDGVFTALAKNCEPIVACIPFDEKKGMYAHKGNYPMEGMLCLNNNKFSFSRNSSFFIIDDQKGYYPYIMKWDWVTACGYDTSNNLIAFNLTRNQSMNQYKYNENCVWINGKLNLLPPVTFYKKNDVWTIKDEEGFVNLIFNLQINNDINANALVVESHYKGPYGVFNGYVKDSQGNIVLIENMFGMGENFYIRC